MVAVTPYGVQSTEYKYLYSTQLRRYNRYKRNLLNPQYYIKLVVKVRCRFVFYCIYTTKIQKILLSIANYNLFTCALGQNEPDGSILAIAYVPT